MDKSLRQSDVGILTAIINDAKQAFFRESRLNKKGKLNLLRILTAHKKLSNNFEHRKEQIRQYIICMEKYSHPQSYQQWISALEQIKKKSKTNSRFSQKMGDHEQSEMISLNGYSISGMTGMNGFSRELTEDYEAREYQEGRKPSKRATFPIRASARHCISFEPIDNKQNNFENINQIHEDSIIQKLKPHSSNFFNSKITNNTKDFYSFENTIQNEEQMENMNKSIVYHDTNYKIKGFYGLLANFQTYGEFKRTRAQAMKGYKKIYGSKFFSHLQFFYHEQKQKKKQNSLAQQFRSITLKTKVIKIIKLLVSLRIQPKKALEVSKFNHINFSFLSTMLFSLKQTEQDQSLSQKLSYYLDIEEYGNVHKILRSFSKVYIPEKKTLINMFEMEKKALLARTFFILKQQKNQYKKPFIDLQNCMKRNRIRKIRNNLEEIRTEKQKQIISNSKNNLFIQQKYFKLLSQLIVSKKLYCKRYRYLKQKQRELKVNNLFQFWKKKTQVKQSSRKKKLQMISYFISTLEGKLCRLSFNKIICFYNKDLQKQTESNEQRGKQIMRKIFSALKHRVEQKKKFSLIRISHNQIILENTMNILYRKSSISKGFRALEKTFSQHCIKELFKGLKYEKLSQKLQLKLKKEKSLNVYRQLFISFKLDRQKDEKIYAKAKKVQQKQMMKNFLIKIRGNYEQKMTQRRQKLNSELSNKLSLWLTHKKQNTFIFNLKGKFTEKQSFKKLMVQSQSIYKNKEVSLFLRVLSKQHQISKSLQNFFKQKINFHKKQFIKFIKRGKRINDFLKLKKTKDEKTSFKCLKDAWMKKREINSIVENKFVQNTKKKVISILKMWKDEQITENDKKLKACQFQIKKIQFRSFLKSLKDQISMKKKYHELAGCIFIKRLSSFHKNEKKLRVQRSIIQNKKKNQVFDKLKQYNGIPELRQCYKNHDQLGMKIIWFNRLKSNLFKKMFEEKRDYMAYKCRAIKLMGFAFEALKIQEKKNEEPCFIYAREHFSTEYSSL